jgi:transcriptional regulator with XRE-family HTH domain
MSNKHMGSRFDDFLEDEGMLEEVTAVALKRVIAWQIAQEMKVQNLTKTTLAKRMHTSRAALNRLLDEDDASLTLTTLASAAAALGKTVSLHLAPADGTKPAKPRSRATAKVASASRAAAPGAPAAKRPAAARRGA